MQRLLLREFGEGVGGRKIDPHPRLQHLQQLTWNHFRFHLQPRRMVCPQKVIPDQRHILHKAAQLRHREIQIQGGRFPHRHNGGAAGLLGIDLSGYRIARAAKLTLFDEPEAGIDLWSFARLTETFKAIHAKRESTIIIISHQERIIRLADEIILMANGNVAARGDADEIYPQLMGMTIAGCNMLEVDQTC